MPKIGVNYSEHPVYIGYKVGDDGTVYTRWNAEYIKGVAGRHTRLTDKYRKVEPTYLKDTGRLFVSIRLTSGKRKIKYVHALVMETFVGPCPKGMEVCHSPDPNPTNNNLSNLRYDTKKANHADAVVCGTKGCGERHPRATVTEETVLAIRKEASERKGTRGWHKSLAEKHGVSIRLMKHIIARTSWTHI